MKKSFSYLLPFFLLLVTAILVFRWLQSRPTGLDINGATEGIEISDLTGDEVSPLGSSDAQKVNLSPINEESSEPMTGEIRYTASNDGSKTNFTVFTMLPELSTGEGSYQVWFEGDKGRTKAMKLHFAKGGYLGEGSISSDFDEVNVLISQEQVDDNTVEKELLSGTIQLKKSE